MYRKLLVLGMGCGLLAQQAAAATEIRWDIGKEPSVSVPGEPGEYRLLIYGGVSGANYATSVTRETLEMPALVPGAPPGPFSGSSAATVAASAALINPCAPYDQIVASKVAIATAKYLTPDLTKPNAEEEFSDARQDLQHVLENYPAGCAVDPKARATLAELVAASSWQPITIKLDRGQVLKAKISRKIGTTTTDRNFAYELSTGKRGTWLSSYGFGITPNDDQHFFSRAGDTDTFDIAKKHNNGGLSPTAAVFYTWLPAQRETKDWNYGLAAGIGIDQNNLALFLGPHITFNQNLGLVVGVALHQQTRLRGEYEVGQTLTENLTSDALEEKVNRTSWFIGVTMRFGAPEK